MLPVPEAPVMSRDERHERMDTARVRAELTMPDLWLRYVALGGTGDAFDLDGYLQGVVPLETFQQDVLAQALNEALEDSLRAHRIPLSTVSVDSTGDGRLGRLVDELLDDPPMDAEREGEPGVGST
ncbi:hypothetical protein [Geodermatophilus normandii]|uniref:Uncharacterized protein n=1 Tax=Geodermatophilus normandii TaxID=1137989 RepID=A0A6P0GIW6_9ACTN|nr:hypothetical protein [Geodermatophilus normandii]NEM07091.1 hypothetical protein [Geodermatophilus normandii]